MESTWQPADGRLAVKPDEAARLIGISRSKLFEHLATGEIMSFKDGRTRLIPVESLQSWITRQLAESAA